MARPRTKTSIGSPAPLNEVGFPNTDMGSMGFNPLTGGLAPWRSFIDTNEYVPELMWPQSVETYNQMRTDSQIAGLWTAVAYGICQLKYVIDPNGAREEIVTQVSEDLNLPIMGEEQNSRRRMKRRFSHNKHVSDTMLALLYGHAYFEQVGVIENGLWRLRKLAPRMPRTITDIYVAEDGGLVSIKQGNGVQSPEIPVDRLVAFIWQQEGLSWVGRSMLRDCYKNWLIKDRLIRIDAINHERAGGVPIAEGAPNMTPGEIQQMSEMMQAFRIGETSGGAVPYGADVTVMKGTGSNVKESIQYHDEAMARRFLLMVTSLAQGGQNIGSYALSDNFMDFFAIGQRHIAQWYCDVMNEHVIEDWVDWNYGQDEELCPVIRYEGEDDALGVEALKQLVDAKIVIVDEQLEDAIRYRFHLPARTEPRPSNDDLAVTSPPGETGKGAPSAQSSPGTSSGGTT